MAKIKCILIYSSIFITVVLIIRVISHKNIKLKFLDIDKNHFYNKAASMNDSCIHQIKYLLNRERCILPKGILLIHSEASRSFIFVISNKK